jgi:hypothetical protein
MGRARAAGLILLLTVPACSYGQPRTEEVVTYGTQPDPGQLTTSTTSKGAATTSTTQRTAVSATASASTPRPAAAPANPTTASVTIVSTYPGRMVVMLNGVDYIVAANETVGPVLVSPAAQGADWFRITNDYATCGGADSDDYFEPGRSYELRIEAKPGNARCDGTGLPLFTAVLNPGNRQFVG